jgi:hypothetical protein
MRRQRYGDDWPGGKAPRSGVFTRRAPRSQSSSDHAVKPSFVMRNGERIETYTLVMPSSSKARGGVRKASPKFEVQFVKVPIYWVKQLSRANNPSTFKLAYYILGRAHECKYCGGEIILSTEATRIPRATRVRAVRELVKLGLIEIQYSGRQAVRVTNIIIKEKKE